MHKVDGRGRASLVRLLAAFACGLSLLIGVGCSSRAKLHPALRADDEVLKRAISRGKLWIASGEPPTRLLPRLLEDVNIRVSSQVILRSAGCWWPVDEIAFHIAQEGDSSDAGVRKAVRQALKVVERDLNFTVVVQLPKARDPASVEFLLRTSTGVTYPPLAVEKPVFMREVGYAFDPTAPTSSMYYYVVHFPVRGGPGIAPVGQTVRFLYLVVKDGESEGTAKFPLRTPSR